MRMGEGEGLAAIVTAGAAGHAAWRGGSFPPEEESGLAMKPNGEEASP